MPPLQKQIVPIKLGLAGIDAGANPQLQDQAWSKAENVRWTLRGAPTKRYGFKLQGELSERHLAAFRGEPVAVDRALRQREGSSYAQVTTLSLTDIEAAAAPARAAIDHRQVCCVRVGAVDVWAYTEVDPVGGHLSWLRSVHAVTGRLIDELNLTSGLPNAPTRLIRDGQTVRAVYRTGSTLHVTTVAATGAITGTYDTTIPVLSGRPLDAVRVGPGVLMAATYYGVAPARVAIIHVDIPNTTTTVALEVSPAPDAVAIWLQTTELAAVAWWDDTLLRVMSAGYSTSAPLVQHYGATGLLPVMLASDDVPSMAALAASSTIGHLFFTQTSASATVKPAVYRADVNFNVLPPTAGVSRIAGKCRMVSRPWADRGNTYLAVVQPEADLDGLGGRTGSLFVIDLGGDLAGKSLLATARAPTAAHDGYVADAELDPASSAVVLGARQVRDTAGNSGPTRLVVKPPGALVSAETEHGLILGSSCPLYYDGRVVVETGYLVIPEAPGYSSEAPGPGGLVAGSAYAWRVTYEWLDASGLLHRSAPSPETIHTVGAGCSQVDLRVPHLHSTRRQNVRIVLWRTQASGTVFYRLSTLPSDLVADFTLYTDTTADASLTGRETLYTDGTQRLEAAAPPSGGPHCLHQGRHFVVNAEQPDTIIHYSHELIGAGTPPEYNEALTCTVPPDGGPITALVSFRDLLLVFKAHRVYAVTGTGRTVTGSGTGYQPPYLVSEALGTAHPRSLVALPGLLAFASATGIYTLDAKLQPSPLGDPVMAHTQAHVYRRGVLLPDHHVAVWSSPTGPLLVYDYRYGLWATWTPPGAGVLDVACAAGSSLVLLDSSKAWALAAGTYRDHTTPVITTLETGWFSFAQLLGFARCSRLLIGGYSLAGHILTVDWQYNHDPTWADPRQLDTAHLKPFGPEAHLGAGLDDTFRDQAMVLRTAPGRRRATAYRVRIRDSGLSEDQPSYILTGLAAVVGVRPGAPARPGPARRLD